jgi:hypothetical protein
VGRKSEWPQLKPRSVLAPERHYSRAFLLLLVVD